MALYTPIRIEATLDAQAEKLSAALAGVPPYAASRQGPPDTVRLVLITPATLDPCLMRLVVPPQLPGQVQSHPVVESCGTHPTMVRVGDLRVNLIYSNPVRRPSLQLRLWGSLPLRRFWWSDSRCLLMCVLLYKKSF
jgi:hypothetical protein